MQTSSNPHSPTKRLILIGAIILVVIVVMGVLLMDSGGIDEKIVAMMKYAPPEMIGAGHVDGSFFRKLTKEIRAASPEDANPQAMEAAIAILAKVDSIDFFTSAGQDITPSTLIVVQGDIRYTDIVELLGKINTFVDDEEMPLAVGNGRYDFADKPFRIIAGSEADDVADNVILFGSQDLLADGAVEQLGKERNKSIEKALNRLDNSTMLWGAADLSEMILSPMLPTFIAFSLDLDSNKGLYLQMTFRDKKSASQLDELFNGPYNPIAGMFTTKQSGKKYTITCTSPDKMVEALIERRNNAKRTMSLSNLMAIGKAIAIYKASHNDNFPPNLEVLIGDVLSANQLISPMSGRKMETDEDGKPTAPSDYTYMYPLSDSAPADLVMAYENPKHYKGEGTTILFADTHVAFHDMETFKKALAETEEWIAEQNK